MQIQIALQIRNGASCRIMSKAKDRWHLVLGCGSSQISEQLPWN